MKDSDAMAGAVEQAVAADIRKVKRASYKVER